MSVQKKSLIASKPAQTTDTNSAKVTKSIGQSGTLKTHTLNTRAFRVLKKRGTAAQHSLKRQK